MEKWLLIDRNKRFTEMLEGESINLSSIRKMSYQELETFCQELLQWKLFVANRSYIDEAVDAFMNPRDKM
jgi:hypothetical protein